MNADVSFAESEKVVVNRNQRTNVAEGNFFFITIVVLVWHSNKTEHILA